MRFFHYTGRHRRYPFRELVQKVGDKPSGLWVSAEDSWEEWCLGEGFRLHEISVRYRVYLQEERILYLGSEQAMLEFTEKFSAPPEDAPKDFGLKTFYIDWPLVSKSFDAILIYPYQWSCRLTDNTRWYYGWDCACGCIWNSAAIKSIRRDRDYHLEDLVRREA